MATACDLATPKVYSADPITAWVVDADTGKPIEGANVLAEWEMKFGLENHGTNYAMVMEAVTDPDGRFALPGWGPKLVMRAGGVTNAAPRLTIFKPGYRIGGGGNSGLGQLAPSHMKSEWNGKTFKLTTFSGSSREYSEHLYRFLQRTIESLFENGCNYRSFPMFLKAVDKQARELGQHVHDSQLLTIDQVGSAYRSRCGYAGFEIEGMKK